MGSDQLHWYKSVKMYHLPQVFLVHVGRQAVYEEDVPLVLLLTWLAHHPSACHARVHGGHGRHRHLLGVHRSILGHLIRHRPLKIVTKKGKKVSFDFCCSIGCRLFLRD